ncbi:MAG: hypothetical protein GC164_05790 [Phycisphaera sp.]|nr:hypothetical protein [Phycisphaera sp.]
MRRLTMKQWRQRLGETIPLGLAPDALRLSVRDVRRAIHARELPVYTFHATDGRVFRVVRVRDVLMFRRNPLTLKRMTRAMESLLKQPATLTRRRAA